MSSKKFKCILHYQEVDRGVIIYDNVTYSSLLEMVMSKLNFNLHDHVNLKVRIPSIDTLLDITDDNEVSFFVECALESPRQIVDLYVSKTKSFEEIGSPTHVSFIKNKEEYCCEDNDSCYENEPNFTKPGSSCVFSSDYEQEDDFQNYDSGLTKPGSSFAFNSDNEQEDYFENYDSGYKHEASFTKPGSSFAFLSDNEQENDFENNEHGSKHASNFTKPGSSCAYNSNKKQQNEKKNSCFDLNKQPPPVHQNWTNCLKYIPQVPETPLYQSKQIPTEFQHKENRVKLNEIFIDKAELDHQYRLKALEDGFEFVTKKNKSKYVQH